MTTAAENAAREAGGVEPPDGQQLARMESLTAMAAGVAHDFNNHLATILGNTEILEQRLPPDSPLREHARRIHESAQTALDLTLDILTYTGRFRLNLAETDLAALAGQLVPELRRVAGDGATLDLRIAAPLPTVNLDGARVARMIRLLVANAAAAVAERSPPRAIAVDIGVVDSADELSATGWIGEPLQPGRHASIAVADNGCGIGPDAWPRVFDPFFATRIRARGMGLPVVLGIVRAHHGAIRVESAPGRGTTVRVLLPIPAVHQ